MRLLLSILLLLLFVPSWSEDERLVYLGRDTVMRAEPVPLDAANPGRRRTGSLTFLGGVRLTSTDRQFGGFSALMVDGNRIMLLSDGGSIARFTIDSRLRIGNARFGLLPAGPGSGWIKRDRDSESLTRDAAGNLWVGFEDSNQIWRYSPGFGASERHAAPRAMRHWDRNNGPEAMVRLKNGAFVVFSESSHAPHSAASAAVFFRGDPTLQPNRGFRFNYQPPKGFDPSDAVQLPDGRLIVLNRRFKIPNDFSAKLTLVDPHAIRSGALVRGRDIATLAAPLLHDNFEGIAVAREGHDTILWIVSDDNQSILQKTLLLKFRLEPGF